jgi:sulfopyruvate decarboxylase alpha subunit
MASRHRPEIRAALAGGAELGYIAPRGVPCMTDDRTAAAWPDRVFEVLRRWQVAQVGFVPDAGHSRLIRRAQESNEMRAVTLTTEEEGVALIAGAWLGGQRGALLMQSSGVGNCVNMLSLAKNGRFPLLMLVTMRGQWGEFNPWQVPMGQITEDVLKLSGVLTFPVDRAEDVEATVEAAARMAFEGPAAVAVLLSQRLIGAKSFGR